MLPAPPHGFRRRSDATPDDVQAARNQGYLANFVADMGKAGSGDWDVGDWAVVIYVVVGVIVVGAFVFGGAKALYDLAVNEERVPGLQGGRAALLLFRPLPARPGRVGPVPGRLSHGGALRVRRREALPVPGPGPGGRIHRPVGARPGDQPGNRGRAGGYLVGGPLVRFGRYRPLAFTLEFLNGTSNHSSIGWISKSRMTLAAKTRGGFLYGAHLGAVFYDLRFTDGLVLRRGDINRDLSLLMGLDAGWAFW